jgi:maltooligosyltrehalose trehalohydrolase
MVVSGEIMLGATYSDDRKCHFLVWAPFIDSMDVIFTAPRQSVAPMLKDEQGYHYAVAENIEPGSLYWYRVNRRKRYPDPASRYQPDGVHGPSQVVDIDFPWEDRNWSGISFHDYIIYEIHVGTFTSEGTFEAIIPYLDGLKELGITAIEIMPVAQFPGSRNWGYDGVLPFAVQDSYGGPEGLKRLVNACHKNGLAMVLDVVYNHVGPEGNHLGVFGPYFTDRYHTPWGSALNFDGPHSDHVRRFFIENALYWITDYHIDALRLDALHIILDITPYVFIEQLAAEFHKQAEKLGRKAYLIGESSINNARFIKPPELGGYGLDAQWNDDFHHSLHTLLTNERTGYYQDYGQLEHLAKAFREGFAYSGEYSLYRQRRHGTSSKDIPAFRFVVFAQNHDQVGNRVRSDRLSQILNLEELKLTAGIVLLSPFVPLIFMGEEYGETAPFPYFISHSEPELVEFVRKGRKAEFTAFKWQGEIPDPQDETTFQKAKLRQDLRNEGHYQVLNEFYKKLIKLRKESPALANLSKDTQEVEGYEETRLLLIRRWYQDEEVVIIFNFSNNQTSFELPVPVGHWQKQLDSSDVRWLGNGSIVSERIDSEGEVALTLNPKSFVLFTKEI